MSYDIDLKDPITKETIVVSEPRFFHQGGTYAIGGSNELSLNITYNYAKHFYRTMGENGIRTIYGMTGQESLQILNSAIEQLGDDMDADYWTSTEGNAKQALYQLQAMAKMRPDGVWAGD